MDCPGGERVSKMRRLRKEGFFVSHIKGRDGRFPYRLRVRFGEDFIEGPRLRRNGCPSDRRGNPSG
jgi:hypothetical protein